MQLSDFQFIRDFLYHEIDLDPNEIYNILSTPISIEYTGTQKDQLVDRDYSLVYKNPSSINQFLFHVLHSIFEKHTTDKTDLDKIDLSLMYLCLEYIHQDEAHTEPPILVSYEKLTIPYTILSEIVQPLIGKLRFPKALFIPCNFTDCCRVAQSMKDIENYYPIKNIQTYEKDFPILIKNTNISNKSAEWAHLILTCLYSQFSQEKVQKIIRYLLLEDEQILNLMLQTVYHLDGDKDAVWKFLTYLESHGYLEYKDYEQIHSAIQKNSLIKISGDNYTPSVWKQWSQWSMLMGLLEKQLSPMRGSMWPATERLKPHEDKLRNKFKEEKQKRRKKHLNFEDMLEIARDLYDHNAIEPGKLLEIVLKDERYDQSTGN